MKTIVITLVTFALFACTIAPVAAAEAETPQPTAIERLVRQEDARRNDPRLGATREWETVGIADPWIAARGSAQLSNIPVAPTVEVVVPSNGFDWLDAVVGAAAAAAILAASAGIGLAVRTHALRQA